MKRTGHPRSHGQRGQAKAAARRSAQLERLNLNAAGIDIGAMEHWVAVPAERALQPVRCFGTFTTDLYALAAWLKQCGIETVAMESSGVYWIGLFEVLEERGFDVQLVNPQHIKQVPGRKTDVSDCQWLQELHTYGLLRGCFRPTEQECELRSYVRQRGEWIAAAGRSVQHMQKALEQMNVKLTEVLSDITGETGLGIIRAIVAGERDPAVLAHQRNWRCKHDEATIARALAGHWRAEHVFALRQAVEHYDFVQQQLAACDEQIETSLQTLLAGEELAQPSGRAGRRQGNAPAFDVRAYVYTLTGVDLTQIEGIDALTALKVLSEIGLDMTRWPSAKHFASWLGLCPGNKISGGKRYSSRSKPCANRAAAALRLAAQSLARSHSALGAYYRRMRARLGGPQAITATAHKLARLIYSMIRYGTEYVDAGQDAYEHHHRDRVLRNLKRKAQALGYQLIELAELPGQEAATMP